MERTIRTKRDNWEQEQKQETSSENACMQGNKERKRDDRPQHPGHKVRDKQSDIQTERNRDRKVSVPVLSERCDVDMRGEKSSRPSPASRPIPGNWATLPGLK